MDGHLRRLVVRHGSGGGGGGVRFGSVDVKSCPFVVERLGIRVLPCVVGFRDGVGVGRVVGFEGLGVFAGREEEEQGGLEVTKALEGVIVGWGVFGERTKGWGVGVGMDGSSGEDEDEEELKEQKRRKNGGLFGNARRGIQERKKGVSDDDDDDWD